MATKQQGLLESILLNEFVEDSAIEELINRNNQAVTASLIALPLASTDPKVIVEDYIENVVYRMNRTSFEARKD